MWRSWGIHGNQLYKNWVCPFLKPVAKSSKEFSRSPSFSHDWLLKGKLHATPKCWVDFYGCQMMGSSRLPALPFFHLLQDVLWALERWYNCLRAEHSTVTYSQHPEPPEASQSLYSPHLTLSQTCYCRYRNMMKGPMCLGAFAFNFSNCITR